MIFVNIKFHLQCDISEFFTRGFLHVGVIYQAMHLLSPHANLLLFKQSVWSYLHLNNSCGFTLAFHSIFQADILLLGYLIVNSDMYMGMFRLNYACRVINR